MKTIEKKVSETLLQEDRIVTIGGVEYKAAPPSTSTLVKVSELISELPFDVLDVNKAATETLRIAKDCDKLNEILAVMILGYPRRSKRTLRYKLKLRRLAGVISEVSPEECHKALTRLLPLLQVADFFAFTAFLLGIRVTMATRKVETTASGQRSQVSSNGTV